MALIGRMLAVTAAYLLACVAASFVLTLGMLLPAGNDVFSLPVDPDTLGPMVALGAAGIAAVAMLPALLLIVLAEGFAWRSVAAYGVLGAALALLLFHALGLAGFVADPDDGKLLARTREVLAAAGISGGLVYWVIAGRRAGAWRRAG